MKLMVVGGGGREHAIIKKLKENPSVEVIYALPGNGGIAADAVWRRYRRKGYRRDRRVCKGKEDRFRRRSAGRSACARRGGRAGGGGDPQLRSEKGRCDHRGQQGFCQESVKKYGIPTAAYEVFEDMDAGARPILRPRRFRRSSMRTACARKGRHHRRNP